MTGNYRFMIVCLLLVLVGLYLNLHSDLSVPLHKPLAEFPLKHEGWQMISQSSFNEKVLEQLKPTDYLYRQYISQAGRTVSLYIGYHNGGKGCGEIHSPKHCLPGNGWQKLSDRRMVLAKSTGDLQLVRAVYQKGESRELFLYWFQVQGQSLSNEYLLKFSEIKNSMINRRRDATFIRISVPFDGEEQEAVAAGMQFVQDFYPLIHGYLPS